MIALHVLAQQRGPFQRVDAHVKGKAHQRVELRLRGISAHHIAHRVRVALDVLQEQGVCRLLRNAKAHRHRLAVDTGCTPSDCRDAYSVLVCGQAAPLKLFDEIHARPAYGQHLGRAKVDWIGNRSVQRHVELCYLATLEASAKHGADCIEDYSAVHLLCPRFCGSGLFALVMPCAQRVRLRVMPPLPALSACAPEGRWWWGGSSDAAPFRYPRSSILSSSLVVRPRSVIPPVALSFT